MHRLPVVAAAAAAVLALTATGCRQKPILEQIPASEYTPPSPSGSATP